MINYLIPDNIAISDSGFLFVPSSGESFTVNPIGREILIQIKNKKTLDEIKNLLTEDYEIDAISVDRDIIDFINQLKNYGILKEV